ncbi:MAG: hypothetical protein E2O39_11095 [Planctomycetota bacterium]|nr:MAG: hypothetical protein E2O39_11095 [Planctomycetota bacterium]
MSARAALLLALPLAAGCVSVTWEYIVTNSRPEPGTLAILRPGEADLTECLATLGAPILVQEHMGGIAVAYGWTRERAWSISVSVPIVSEFSGSARFNDLTTGLEGILLLFDEHDRLTTIRQGYLRDLKGMIARSPQFIDDDDELDRK